jgi:hypothetical protein
MAYSFSAVIMGGMILFAQQLQDSMDKLQSLLPLNSDWQVQAFRLGTFSDRLMGYQNVLTNPGAWPLLANPLHYHLTDITYTDVEFSHDILSQMILRIGAIPTFVGGVAMIYFFWRAHRAILSLPMGKDGIRPLAARLMAIIVVFIFSQAAGAGITVFPMNFWTGIFVGLLCGICVVLQKSTPQQAGETGPLLHGRVAITA